MRCAVGAPPRAGRCGSSCSASAGCSSYSGLAVLALVVPAGRRRPASRGSSSTGERGRASASGDTWEPVLVVRLYLVLPLALFGLPTVLMGLSFPVLQRAVHDDPAHERAQGGPAAGREHRGLRRGQPARGARWAHAGSARAGALRLLLVAGRRLRRSWAGAVRRDEPLRAARRALLLVAVALPGRDRLWLRLHGASSCAALRRTRTRPASARSCRGPTAGSWSVNGKDHSWLPFGGVHTRLGAIPALVHPAPRRTSPSSASDRATPPGPPAEPERDAVAHRLRDRGAATAPC